MSNYTTDGDYVKDSQQLFLICGKCRRAFCGNKDRTLCSTCARSKPAIYFDETSELTEKQTKELLKRVKGGRNA